MSALHSSPSFLAALALAGGLACVAPAAQAEKADRNKPMVVEAARSGTVDLQGQVMAYSGNVVISQGTMVLRAENIEVRESADGYRFAAAIGAPGRPATWSQRRDVVDETVEGSADRIEFDSRADTLRFIGNGAVRRLRGGSVADEITGGAILWDNVAEVFRVEGGAVSAVNPGGRVRVVLSPRPDPAASAASATGALKPSRSLEGQR